MDDYERFDLMMTRFSNMMKGPGSNKEKEAFLIEAEAEYPPDMLVSFYKHCIKCTRMLPPGVISEAHRTRVINYYHLKINVYEEVAKSWTITIDDIPNIRETCDSMKEFARVNRLEQNLKFWNEHK